MTIVLFLTALALSATAAYYSIAGLAAIFSAATISIIIMGSILEVAKLVTISWLYRNWRTTPRFLKTYFTMAVAILMLITSMGVFGYLSRAHIEQTSSTASSSVQVQALEDKIASLKDNIELNRRALSQMDESVNQLMSRSSSEDGALRASNLRKAQQKERSRLMSEIQVQQSEIAKLTEELTPLRVDLKKLESEVGPIKYVASLIYGNEVTPQLIETSVKYFILLIIVVFDPLAVLLFIAFNIEQQKKPLTESLFSKIHYTSEEHKEEPKGEVYTKNISDEVEVSDELDIYKDKTDGTKLKFILE